MTFGAHELAADFRIIAFDTEDKATKLERDDLVTFVAPNVRRRGKSGIHASRSCVLGTVGCNACASGDRASRGLR